MRHLKNGVKLLAALALVLSVGGCRKSTPPKIEICILDGAGNADCQLPDGSFVVRAPSELLDYWATNQDDMAKFASWCYDTSYSTAQDRLEYLKRKITKEDNMDYDLRWEQLFEEKK